MTSTQKRILVTGGRDILEVIPAKFWLRPDIALAKEKLGWKSKIELEDGLKNITYCLE